MSDSPSHISVSQFAAREGVSRPRVLQWLAARRIPGALRVGRQWILPADTKVARLAPGRPAASENASALRLLRTLAKKYLWWLTPDEAMTRPDRVILQVLDIGDYEDALRLQAELGDLRLARALRCAEAGQLAERSWNYWHHRLKLTKAGRVPPVPRRHFT